MSYTEYFNKFPKIKYDINKKWGKYSEPQTVTNILFRVQFLKEALNNIAAYYVLEVDEGETPDILAHKVYRDSGAAWMILMANNIIDPQWEWPLAYKEFNNYIIGKYGSVEAAQSGIHHYEKVVETTNSVTGETTIKRYTINKSRYTTLLPSDMKYQYYGPFPDGQGFRSDTTRILIDSTLYTSDLDFDYAAGPTDSGSLSGDGYYIEYYFDDSTVNERIYKNAVSFYDWEQEENEAKREIKVVKREYYQQLLTELSTMTDSQLNFAINRSFKKRLV